MLRPGLPHPDRLALERAGWATTLDYRENHGRDGAGRLERVRVEWHAVAERVADGVFIEAAATAARPGLAWARLRARVERAERGRARDQVRREKLSVALARAE